MTDIKSHHTEIFDVNEDIASALRDLDDEELRSFISIREDASDENLNKAASYACFLLFKNTGSIDYLREAIEVVDEWLVLMPDVGLEQSRPSRIRDVLCTELEQTNQGLKKLDKPANNATTPGAHVRSAHPRDHLIQELEGMINFFPDGPMLSALGSYFDERFESTDCIEDLNNAIKYTEQAINQPCDQSTMALRLTNLGGYYGSRSKRLGSSEDLDRAIEVTKKAIAIEHGDQGQLARSFTGLETWLSLRFERTHSDDDLGEAVEAGEMAVALTPEDNPDHHGRLNDLANRLSDRFGHCGSEDDLVKAIKLGEMALSTKHKLSNHDKAIYLSNLGLRLYELFKGNGSRDNLNRAIDYMEQAVVLGLSDSLSDLPSYLNNLGILRNERFEQNADLTDLDVAIQRAAMAVERTPRNHPEIIIRMMNWGCWLRSRSQHTGSLDDVNRAIDVAKSALESLPPDHVSQVALFNELSSSYSVRFARSSAVSDLDRGLRFAKAAYEFKPRDQLRWTSILNNYANLLGDYAIITESSESLAQAIEIARLSIKETPISHTSLPSRIGNLGNLLGRQFRVTGSRKDLDDAIANAEEALHKLPSEHLDRARYIVNLGTWLDARSTTFDNKNDIHRALKLYEEGSELITAVPSVRLLLAIRAARIHAESSSWEESIHFLEKSVDLLPSISLRSLKHTDKQNMLGDFFGLASDAAAVSLNVGKSPYHALQLLERGRGIIASLLMDMRGDISDLETQYPELANEFITLRDKLSSQGVVSDEFTSLDSVTSWDAQVRQRRVADSDFNKLIQRIRDQPNFHNFLLLASEEEIMDAAKPGPIVVINTSRYRCDAFLIQHDKISVLKLQDLKAAYVKEEVKKLQSLRAANYTGMRDLLNWLWDKITGPSLNALGCKASLSTEDLPRIWWIPTGLLSQLPLHAAGNYRQQPFDSVLDRSISSYALSVKSLIHGRLAARSMATKSSDLGVLISMEHTPGMTHGGDLEFAKDEVNMLRDMYMQGVPFCGSRKFRSKRAIEKLSTSGRLAG
ncbi:hypothetical protein FGRMN_7043 [Fusarium graminum]|nr:hypothetical protein FGRMN_7043 [Fusarium graminum]